MSYEQNGRRFASLDALRAGRAMSPQELVEDAIRRMTDGTLTFSLQADEFTIAAGFSTGTHYHAYSWSKALLREDCSAAEAGLRELLALANGVPA